MVTDLVTQPSSHTYCIAEKYLGKKNFLSPPIGNETDDWIQVEIKPKHNNNGMAKRSIFSSGTRSEPQPFHFSVRPRTTNGVAETS